jgi:hypothetical protein
MIPKLNAFGDYIFLIILAAASIIQAVIQKNKKEEAQKAERRRKVERELDETGEFQSREEEGGSVFDRMEEEWLPDIPKEEPKPVFQQTVRSKIAEKSKQFDIQNYKMFEGENMESPEIQRGTKLISSKSEFKQRFTKTFNLKKAVIYSEVLNRKYF